MACQSGCAVHCRGILHPIWNGIRIWSGLLYVVTILRTPTERFARGWRSKIFWIVGGTVLTAYGSGLYRMAVPSLVRSVH